MENLRRVVGDAGSFLTRAVQDAHLTDDATTMYSRAKQYTEEKLGKSERTENDPVFEVMANRTDKTKSHTEKLVKNTEAVLVPNPAARLETFMFENIPVDRIGVTNNRRTNLEYLGNDMIVAGNEFGPGTAYGATLIRVGQTQVQLGEINRTFIREGYSAFVAPLQEFLDGEMKNISRERKFLENKRLDLDVCKNRVRKARAMQFQPPKEGIDARALVDQSEGELRIAQSDYDKQVEIVKILMEGLSSIQINHQKNLKDFVEAQARYYKANHLCMMELQKELSNCVTPSGGVMNPNEFSDATSHRSSEDRPPFNGISVVNDGIKSGRDEYLAQVNLKSPPIRNSTLNNVDFF